MVSQDDQRHAPQQPSKPKKQVRRTTKGPYKVPEDLVPWFGTSEIRTAGIFADTLWEICRAMTPEVMRLVDEYIESIDPPLSRPELTYLREIEGRELLERIRKATAHGSENTEQPQPTQEDAPEPMGPTCEGFRVGQLVKTRLGRGDRGTIMSFHRATNDRGPTAIIRMEEGDHANEEIPFYVRELPEQEDAPAARPKPQVPYPHPVDELAGETPPTEEPQPQPNGNGWVTCKGPHAGKRVSAAAVCARCDDRGDCPELAQHRRQAAGELF